jgi:predicted transcriptional regulator
VAIAQTTIHLSASLKEKLRRFAAGSGQSVSEVVVKAIESYLDRATWEHYTRKERQASRRKLDQERQLRN